MDIRDVFFLSGLALLGYGLYLFQPWVAFAVVGALLMVVGILMRVDNGHSVPAGSSERDEPG